MNAWKHKRRICNLILGLKGLRDRLLFANIMAKRLKYKKGGYAYLSIHAGTVLLHPNDPPFGK